MSSNFCHQAVYTSMLHIHSIFRKFPEFAGIIYNYCYCEKRNVHWHLYHLWDAVWRKHPEKWRMNIWFLFHDNAPAHQLVLVKDFLAKNNVTTLEHPYTLLTWLQLIFTHSLKWISMEGTVILWCYLHNEEYDWRAKTFTVWFRQIFPTCLVLTEVYSCTNVA